jgi:tRNA splicing endonuclease
MSTKRKMLNAKLQNNQFHLENQILYPEEAIYLMEKKKLQVSKNKIPISIQQAIEETKIDLGFYLLYSFLRNTGHIAYRLTEQSFRVYKSRKGINNPKGMPEFIAYLCQ